MLCTLMHMPHRQDTQRDANVSTYSGCCSPGASHLQDAAGTPTKSAVIRKLVHGCTDIKMTPTGIAQQTATTQDRQGRAADVQLQLWVCLLCRCHASGVCCCTSAPPESSSTLRPNPINVHQQGQQHRLQHATVQAAGLMIHSAHLPWHALPIAAQGQHARRIELTPCPAS